MIANKFKQIYDKTKNKSAFARELGYTYVYLNGIASGKFPITLKFSKRLEEWSNGKIKPSWLLGIR